MKRRTQTGLHALKTHIDTSFLPSAWRTPRVERAPIKSLKPFPRNSRTHSKKQIQQIANSIARFGWAVPIVADENRTILSGHGRYYAAQLLGLTHVPVIFLTGLSDAEKRAFVLADNKIATNAGWDRRALAEELGELAVLLPECDLSIEVTGFEPVEIDQLFVDFEEHSQDPEDEIHPSWSESSAVCKPGDAWVLGSHKLLCGDARRASDIARLMGSCRADLAFLDPPYNTRVSGVVGRGRVKHAEFAMASGEMSPAEFARFLTTTLEAAASASRDGAIHFVCMDWRHIELLLEAAKLVYGDTLNIVVWVKSNAGQGSFYRSQHEFIAVFRVGKAPHLNNVELGRHGRSRSNVWRYAGVNTFRAGRMDDLQAHPTVKPVELVADAIKDCTRRGGIVLDTFCGAGTTILAAERVGRHARALEIEPRYVDVAIRRWQHFTRRDAVLEKSGQTFEEVAADWASKKRGRRR